MMAGAASEMALGRSVMVVSREAMAGLETALAIALGPKPSDGGESENPHVTVMCKRMDFKASSGADRGVRHVAPGDFRDEADMISALITSPPAGPKSVLILDNILQPAIRRLLPHWGHIIFVTAYPVFSPGSAWGTVVATPTNNSFTWSSLYKTLNLAADPDATPDEVDASFTPKSFNEMTKSLKAGDVLCCRAKSPQTPRRRRRSSPSSPLAPEIDEEPVSWAVSAQPLTNVLSH